MTTVILETKVATHTGLQQGRLAHNMFRHRHHLRRWAARVLLMWLFGVGASLGYACLVPAWAGAPDGRSLPATASPGLAHDPVMAGSADDHDSGNAAHQHDGEHDHPGYASKANCQDFCDKASVSIPPLKSALDDAHDLGLPPPVVVIDLPMPASVPVQSWVPRRDGLWAPSIPITFLRLAL